MAPKTKVYVVGVGMTKFEKPGSREDFDYPQMAKEAVTKALADARITMNDIKQACVGYVYGDSTCGQRALYEIGMTGLPIYNFMDRTNPMDKHVEAMADIAGINNTPITAQLFGNAAKQHMNEYGTKEEHLAKIAYKNHKHSVNNPYSQFREEYTLEQIMNSPRVFGPLTKLQCCPTSDGSAAALLASEEFVHRHGLENQAVEIVGMEMATDLPSTFSDQSCMKIVGYDMTKAAAEKLFQKANYKPQDVDVVELHDCFSANELITYEALGLCGPGEAPGMIESGNNTYGGVAQCAELCWQLRGLAEKRQVPGAKLALQHNIGLGGAAVVALYRLGFPQYSSSSISVNLTAAANSPDGFRATALFNALETAMQEDKDKLIEKVRGVYAFKVKNGPGGTEGYWIVNAKTGKGSVEFNGKAKPDVTFIIDDTDVVDLISGKLNPQKAFFQGKIKIQGNMGLAMKLTELQRRAQSRIEEIRSKL
ncbi:Non-specific lipid-transfer protein [Gryllus bimaculatus]|nr:Non-specific lipid-transfer protein [Gryllus bimaculatus]